jgi:hypothetical protein
VKDAHRKIAKIALDAGGRHGLALAGGYAVRVHGMGSRPSEDVDLFADWQRRAEFSAAVAAVVGALEAAGYRVTVGTRFETFARLFIAPAEDPEAISEKLELSADWRGNPPVMLEIGPVLHPDDAVANKMCALFGRAQPRDFLDIDAVLASGRYSHDRLLELAANADAGFDQMMFAGALSALDEMVESDFAEYQTSAEQIAGMRERFASWRDELLARAQQR